MVMGPIGPFSAESNNPDVVPGYFEGAANNRAIEAFKVAASLGSNRTLGLVFNLPPADPGGTLKLKIMSLADVASTQVAKLRTLWAAVAAGENPDTIALNDEHSGGDLTISHATADDDKIKITKVTLDADTITYGTDEIIMLNVDLKTSGWTLAVPWYFVPSLLWE